MDLAPVFIGTTTLSISILLLETYTKKENSNYFAYYCFLVGFIISLYPSIACTLQESDDAYKSLNKDTIVVWSMISQLLLVLGFSIKMSSKKLKHGIATFVLLSAGIGVVINSF